MTNERGGHTEAVCPGCGGTDVRSVEEATVGKGALREGLAGRLAKGPDKGGDGCLHFVEGMVITGIGIALAVFGVQQHKPLYTAGGIGMALVMFVGTLVVVRSDGREKAAEQAGAERADRLWQPARYCYGCTSVFCPGGAPWQGVLTPEQFKKLVWTQAGYEDQLDGGDKASAAEVPRGTLTEQR